METKAPYPKFYNLELRDAMAEARKYPYAYLYGAAIGKLRVAGRDEDVAYLEAIEKELLGVPS